MSENPSSRVLTHRPRRLRHGRRLRQAVCDVRLAPHQLIYPLFITLASQKQAVASMPGVYQWPVVEAVAEIKRLASIGITQFMLFGVIPPNHKDDTGSFALSMDNPVCQALVAVRQAKLDVILYADLCLCEYTRHGHCGALSDDPNWVVDNDATLNLLAQQAVVLAKAGADVVAPSGMMDGMVATIRHALDSAGRHDVAILSYSIKYASNFYGPFREAGQGGMTFGDRHGYQMDFARRREWRTELQLDLQEGADMVMVKPAMSYLDIIYQARQACDVPLVAYHVSGEYAMLMAAAEKGWLELRPAVMESTTAIARAGADLIITYFAPQLAQWLTQDRHP